MTVTVKNLVLPKQMEASQTTQYTASNAKAIIDKFTLTNTSASNVTVSVNLVPSGGSVGPANMMIQTKTIVPSETYNCPEVVGHMLENGGLISTIASAATSITINVSGREIT